MRDLTRRGARAARPEQPQGIAFEIADLLLIRGWADLHEYRMLVVLDHASDDEEYEEVIAFHRGNKPVCHLIMWRDAKSVTVQPLIGRRQRFASVAKALDNIASKPRIIITDITATSWPTDRIN
jgi:hypothetical protein